MTKNILPERIAVIGLGYVGLPVAVAFADVCSIVTGFDIFDERIEALKSGSDWTGEVESGRLKAAGIRFTSDPADLAGTSFFVVTVPTPVDGDRRPDLSPLKAACRTLGPFLERGTVVVFESTVYPGATEEVCAPILCESSGLQRSDFKLAYSPERINPGDKTNTLEKIIKVVAGEDAETLERVARAYEAIIDAGIHRAPSIKVAEAAKVIENTQRDINIALMNELALIFDRLGIRTHDVLDAAATKWNFLRFSPGLVGGHCIGVDPYDLTAKAEAVGHHPEVILAGRRINDDMGRYVASKTVKLLIDAKLMRADTRVAIFGLTFKENVPDLRNSKVADIISELREYGIEPMVHDAMADPAGALHEYGIRLLPAEDISDLDAMIVAVPHQAYLDDKDGLLKKLKRGGVMVDVKSAFAPGDVGADSRYWSL